ncbi:hypothetical protein D3C76_1150100 [compost metagenome]
MTPAGFRETFEQGFLVGIQVQDIALDVTAAHFCQQLGETRQVTGQVARIDGYGNQRLGQLGVNQRSLGQFRQQPGRQVVNAVVAVVLKDVEGGTFTRAGTTADDDQAHD